MKITPRRLNQEDFKEQVSWIGKLLGPLNEHISQVVKAMTGSLTVEDNLLQEIKELEVRTTDLPLRFRGKFAARPKVVIVGGIQEVAANPAPLTGPVSLDWTWENQVVTLNQVFNLQAGKKYRISILVMYA